MRDASKTMYKIGRIFSYVLLGIAALVIVIQTILLIVDAVQGNNVLDNIGSIVGTSIWLGLVIVLIILATKSIKDIESDEKNNSPHIIMIVMGAITGDVFYLLGGIFGLVAIGQEEEAKKEEK